MGQRIFLFLVGLVTLFIGSLFTWLMAQSFLNAMETRSWDEVSATVLEAKIDERQIGEHVPVDFSAAVLYGYEYEGQRYTSELIYPRGSKWAKEKEKAEAELDGIEAGESISCWVNPEEPSLAILKHDTKAAGYSIWFPILFVVGGMGVMIGAFRKRKA